MTARGSVMARAGFGGSDMLLATFHASECTAFAWLHPFHGCAALLGSIQYPPELESLCRLLHRLSNLIKSLRQLSKCDRRAGKMHMLAHLLKPCHVVRVRSW
eukprot:scaffold151667_cov20-Tisochrysis_lutea.AAC.1